MPQPNPIRTLSSLPGFDPRQVAVTGVDDHLPAVPLARLQPDALRQRFARPPVWTPEVVAEARFTDHALRHAAVLVAVVMREQPTVLLTQRAQHLNSHSGQIAFPGGKTDDDDADATATALREASEEVGLAAHLVQVLGPLPHYQTGSAFVITPVVALVDASIHLHPNANEVADVFEVPLQFLMNPAHHRHHQYAWQGAMREWFSMPYDEPTSQGMKERFIWGATAGMLRNLYRLLIAS